MGDNDVLDWLLEESDPGVRYATLTTLLGRPSDDPQVRRARPALMKADPVKAILAQQEPKGHWGNPARFYGGSGPGEGSKYRGTIWQVLFLAKLGADGRDERIRRACEFVFQWSQHRETGGFSSRGSAEQGGKKGGMPCLTGNMVWALHTLGYADDPRWQRALQWLLDHQQHDGGWVHLSPRPLHSCFAGSIKPLMALAAIPPRRRTRAIRQSIERAAKFFLQHRLFRRDHHGFDVAKRTFLRFGFPLGWQTDVLDLLDVLAAAGVRDDGRLADAVAVVLSKRDATGRWKLENTYNRKMWCDIEQQHQPSKWVTLKALRALARIGEARAQQLAETGKVT